MKILQIYKDYYPVLGGIENHVRFLAEGQAARGHEVTVLTTGVTGESRVEQRNGVGVIYAARLFNLSSAPFSLDLYRKASEIRGDIVHVHFPYPFGDEAAAYFARGRKLIMTYHSDIIRQRMMGAVYTPFLHAVLARVDTIIATSPNYIESSPVLKRWREKCAVVPLGISLEEFPPQAAPTSSQGLKLLFVGQLRYYKGLNFLLQAMTQLPDAQLRVVGIGPKEQVWKNLAKQLGVADRVTWAGRVTDAELSRYYATCDIFVLPCSERSEGFGAVQLEAMASCRPVISCDVQTGVAWVNQNEVTGLVTPPKNPTALAEAIARLQADAALRARLGAAGRARVEAEFTVERMVERVLGLYERALT